MERQINGISSMATRHVLADLAALYGQRSGCAVAFASLGGVEAARQVRAGHAADVVVLAAKVMQQLASEGHLVAASCIAIARSGIAIAVPAGAPQPGIGDAEAVKGAILRARRVCYSTGPSGDHLRNLWQRWGIAETIEPRLLKAPPGMPVGDIVARGDADIGFQQRSELLNVPGIDIVGPLPPDIQAVTEFAAGIASRSAALDAARDLIAFLASRDADAPKRQHGLDPA